MLTEKPDNDLNARILQMQYNELTEYHIYSRLAIAIKHPQNRETIKQIATDELKHYEFWKTITGKESRPSRWKIFKYYWLARIFGITFAIKLMEKGEQKAQENYAVIAESIPETMQIVEDEQKHEENLISLLEEEKLNYIGSIVLGLNDALVELTGTLAGLTFALQKTTLIAVVGLITGIAASLSMAASEYLSTKSEGKPNALKSSIYTGFTYIITVFLLIMPYFLLTDYILCLIITLIIAIAIIFVFNYYIAVVKSFSFRQRFFEMALLSMSVAALSFLIGYVVRLMFQVDI